MDSDLEAIRAKRMAELRQVFKSDKGSIRSDVPAGMAGAGEQQQKKQQMEEMRHGMLATILSSEARERLARIKIVKEEKGRQVEDMIIRMAQSGQIRGKVSEQQLIDLLDQISEAKPVQSKITFNRRRMADSDDDEDWGL